VRLADIDERRRVTSQAERLGVAEPIIDGVLRQVDGRCVFLGEDRLCQIHARFGEDEKPLVCRLFPRRALKAEGTVRVGVDPGCTSVSRTFENGPLLSLEMIPSPADESLPLELLPAETALVQLAGGPDMTLARFMATLCGTSPGPELPEAFATRLIARLRTVAPHLRDPENGPMLIALLDPIASWLEREDAPPPWAGRLTHSSEAFALEVIRRSLFLRIADSTLPPIAQTLILLGGILACAYADPHPDRFGPALSAWSRVSRLDGFWVPMLPDTETARWVLTGV
jgi:hypothetical protein